MSEKPVPEEKKLRPKRTWRRRLIRLALVLVGLLVALRIAIPFALPTVLDSLLADIGLRVRYENLNLSLLSGTVQIERAEFLPIDDDGQPIVTIEYARVVVDLPSLLGGGPPHFERVDMHGVEVWLTSDEEGDLVLLPGVEGAELALPEAELPQDQAVDLTPPVFIDAASLQRVRVHVRDPGVLEDHWVEASLEIFNLGTATPTRLEIRGYGPDVLDALALNVTATIEAEKAEATVAVSLRGLREQRAEIWLRALGLQPDADLLSASLSGTVKADASSTPGTLELSVQLEDANVTGDGMERVALDRLEAMLELAPDRTLLRDVTVQGLRGQATVLETGGLLIAGVEVPAASTPTKDDGPGEDDGSIAEPGLPLVVDSVSLTDLDLSLRDETLVPAVVLQFLGGIDARDLAPDASGEQRGTLLLRGSLPGLVDVVEIGGQVSPFTEVLSADLNVRAGGLTLERLAPHLQEMGLRPTLEDGQFSARITARVQEDSSGMTRGSAAIEDIEFVDGEPLLRAQRIAVGDLLAESTRTRLELVEVLGLELFLVRDPNGIFHVLGLQNLQSTVSRAGQAAQAAEVAAQLQGVESRFELGVLRVRDAVVRIDDQLLGAVLGPDNLALDLENLAFGGSAVADATGAVADATGDRAQLDLRVTGALAESLQITGSVTTRPGPVNAIADLRLQGDGMHLTPLEPYLRSFGIEPRIRDGQARATLGAQLRIDEEGNLEFGARITDLALSSAGNTDGISWGSLSLEGGSFGPDGLTVEQVLLEAPVIHATREENGGLRIAGLALSSAPDTGTSETIDAPALDAADLDAPTFRVNHLGLNGGVLQWRDETVSPPVEARVTLNAAAERLNTGPSATPVPISLTLNTNEATTFARFEGDVTLDPDDLRANLEMEIQGIRAGPFASYLPPGLTSDTENAHLTADLRARLSTATEGGEAVELVVENLLFRDADTKTILAQAEALRILAPRIDPQGGVYHFAEISTRGLQLRAQLNRDAGLSALGLSFHTSVETGTGEDTTVDPEPTAAEPAMAERSTGSPVPPRVLVDTLDLEVQRLSILESDGEPLDVRLHLTNPAPLLFLDEYPETLSPLLLHLDGAVSPLVEQITLDLQGIPWNQEARLEANLQVTGIRGQSLERVLPSLASELGAADLEDGELTAKLRVVSDLRRRGVLDFDLSRGISLDLWLEQLALRGTPDGPILFGVDELFLHAPRITPTRVNVASLDIDGIRGQVRRDEEGLHIAGLTLKTRQTEEPAVAPQLPTPIDSPFELAIDRMTTSGLDFEFLNTLSDPPLFAPLTGLDLELEDFSTRAFSEPIPVSFSVSLTAGEVPLPVRTESAGLVRDIVSVAGSLVTARGEVEMEDRLLMEELSVQGDLILYPALEGRLRSSITGLELTALAGPAAEGGVRIGDGVLDGRIEVRFEGPRGAFTDANLTFAHLAIEESTDGPIAQYLRLPAPLNTVIFVLKNDRDEVVIPLSFHTDENGISSGAIYRESILAFRSLVTDAIAASPLRIGGALTGAVTGVVSGIGDLFGLGGGEAETDPGPPPISVTFSPGDTTLTSATRQALDQVADELRRDQSTIAILHHEFGPGDHERAALLGNPSREQTVSLVTSLRQRRLELIRTRTQVAADARVDHAVGRRAEAEEKTQRLQSLDTQLGQAEDALDRVLQFLRPNSVHRTEQRTRAAALGIGNERLQSVRQYLIDATDPETAQRIEIRRARLRTVATTDDGETPLGRITAITRRRKL